MAAWRRHDMREAMAARMCLMRTGGGLRRDAIRDGIRRDEERDEIDAAARASGGMCSLLPSYLVRLYLIIDYSLLAFFISFISSLIPIPIITQSIQSISKFPPTPSCVFSLICGSYACPPPPGVGGADVDDNCVAGVDDLNGRGCGVRSAHSPLGSFATR